MSEPLILGEPVIYAVDRYIDKVRIKKEKKWCQVMKRWDAEYFNTEQEAKDFIIRRARIKLENAQSELRRTKRHLANVVKRFGTPCQHGIDDPEECGLCDDESRNETKRHDDIHGGS